MSAKWPCQYFVVGFSSSACKCRKIAVGFSMSTVFLWLVESSLKMLDKRTTKEELEKKKEIVSSSGLI